MCRGDHGCAPLSCVRWSERVDSKSERRLDHLAERRPVDHYERKIQPALDFEARERLGRLNVYKRNYVDRIPVGSGPNQNERLTSCRINTRRWAFMHRPEDMRRRQQFRRDGPYERGRVVMDPEPVDLKGRGAGNFWNQDKQFRSSRYKYLFFCLGAFRLFLFLLSAFAEPAHQFLRSWPWDHVPF
jgi:hypothetical protein